MTNRINAEGGSIAAGRDISINVEIVINSSVNPLISGVSENLKLKPNKLKKILGAENSNSVLGILKKLAIVYRACNLQERTKLYDGKSSQDGPDGHFDLNMQEQDTLFHQASIFFKGYEFSEAYETLGKLLDKITKDSPIYLKARKCQLISGLIGFGCRNNIEKLHDLFSSIGAEEHSLDDDPEVACLAADILQEICTRQLTTDGLMSACRLLKKGHEESTGGRRAHIANSLGLAYRRLGERDSPNQLRLAITILSEGLSLSGEGSFLRADIYNNLAITYIRLFELEGESQYLEKAKVLLLKSIENIELSSDPRIFMLRPKIHNNLGNTYKQESNRLKCIVSAKKALGHYDEAELTWGRRSAPYEWAMLQKNKGETLVKLGAITRNKKAIKDAIVLADASTKERTIRSSPQQWATSICVFAEGYKELARVNAGIEHTPVSLARRSGKHIKSYEKFSDRWSSTPKAPIHEAIKYINKVYELCVKTI